MSDPFCFVGIRFGCMQTAGLVLDKNTFVKINKTKVPQILKSSTYKYNKSLIIKYYIL